MLEVWQESNLEEWRLPEVQMRMVRMIPSLLLALTSGGMLALSLWGSNYQPTVFVRFILVFTCALNVWIAVRVSSRDQ